MHPNQTFHDATQDQNIAFARDRGFGVLAINGEDGPVLSHVPFIVNTAGDVAELHLVRSNPILRALKEPQAARIAVNGADSYVSPDWYGVVDQVPTWNYVAVHLTGQLERLPQEELRGVLDRQSAVYEDKLRPKAPWVTDKMTPEVLDKMMRMIVPCRMRIEAVDGTWKLSQNKPDEVRLKAADHMDAYGFGSEPRLVAAMMRGR